MTKVADNDFNMPVPRWMRTYPPGPYRYINREYLIISYETDAELLKQILPPPLELAEPLVKFEFIRMPDSTGFGDYTESGQVVPVRYQDLLGTFTLAMFLDSEAPIAGGREIWGYPKKLARPRLFVEEDVLVGTLDYGSVRIATATMGYKHHVISHELIAQILKTPLFLLKNIPGVDGNPVVCQLTRTVLQDIQIKGAWTGPHSLELHPHALAQIASLPIKRVTDAVHFICDLTLPYGEVVEDYLVD
jgi:acetoacetate decarboxylase